MTSLQFAALYPTVHRVLKPLFPTCLWAGSVFEPAIALTFDDGPHPQHTPKLLDVLDRHGVIASFFMLGACVSRSPDVVKAIYDRGHWLGLHGYDHRSFPTLSEAQLRESLQKTQTAITQACHLPASAIVDVRPPNGLFTPQTLDRLHRWNYRPVMWSVVPEDWVNPGTSVVIQRVLQQVINGSIVVLHDGYCGGEDVAQIADQLIPALVEKGYRFVSIDTLWQQQLKLNQY